jgi:hypothetical protein
MTLEDFLTTALAPDVLRRGQRFSNMISHERWNIFQDLQAAGLDPYYRDDLLPAAISFTVDHWNDVQEKQVNDG